MVQTVSEKTHLLFNFLHQTTLASILLVSGFAGAEVWAAEPLVVVGTDWPSLKGVHLAAIPIIEGDGLKGVTFMRKRFSLDDIASGGGAVLYEMQTLAGKKRVFKLQKGWPRNPKDAAENPEMDATREVLGPSGGFVTLSYLEKGGVFSNDYRHLRLQVKCQAGSCGLFLADGSPVDRLFAHKAENDRGIREVRAVTRGTYASLTGTDFAGAAPAVTQRPDKGAAETIGVGGEVQAAESAGSGRAN